MVLESALNHEENEDFVEVTSRPPPPQPTPWLIFFSPGDGDTKDKQTFLSLPDEKCYERSIISQMVSTRCLALTNGWMVMAEEDDNRRCSMINLFKYEEIDVSPLEHVVFFDSMTSGVLTAPPSNPKSTLLFITREKPYVIFNNVGGNNKWYTKKYPLSENGKYDFLWSIVVCAGKIYGISDAGLFTLEIVKKKRVVKRLVARGVPRVANETLCYPSLVECSRELFLVVRNNVGMTENLHRFEVYKMSFRKMEWEKVNTIGDRVFFYSYVRHSDLGCASCVSNPGGMESKFKKDSIYFVADKSRGIMRYDISEGSSSMEHLPPKEAYYSEFEAGWVKTMF